MAIPPRSAALNEANAPLSLPIGVRAPATMYDPAMARSLSWILRVLCLSECARPECCEVHGVVLANAVYTSAVS